MQILEFEGVQISAAKKITKGRLTRFEIGQKEVAERAGIPPIKPQKTAEENQKEAERFQKALSESLECSLEVMAITAACFCDFKRGEVKLSPEETAEFIDEELEFDELEQVATLGGERIEQFEKEKRAKKKSTEN